MEILGLPLDPLIIHAVVILVPLAALGGIAISVLTWARVRYGSLVVVGAFGAAVTTFIAQIAGQDLYNSLAAAETGGGGARLHRGTTAAVGDLALRRHGGGDVGAAPDRPGASRAGGSP